jgi:hypothetical protein
MNDQEDFILAKRLASGAVPTEEALSHATALASTLRRMHQEGSVCGVLVPDSIIIGKRGVRIERNSSPTAPIGPYSSPEQVLGESLDARSDIFVFGAIFYEMLAGRKAFSARKSDDLRKEILERVPAPIAGIPDEIQRVVARCLQKKRENRWQRMNSVLAELKLAAAAARQVQQASDWKEKAAGLRAQIIGVEGKVAAHETAQETMITELRGAIRRLEEKAAEHAAQFAKCQEEIIAMRGSVAGMQKGAQVHARAIESLEAAIAQTDEVVEHVADAFGLSQMPKPMVERVEAVTLARNGS